MILRGHGDILQCLVQKQSKTQRYYLQIYKQAKVGITLDKAGIKKHLTFLLEK